MSTQTKKQHIIILPAELWNITILPAALWIKKVKLLSSVQLFVTPWTTRLPGRLLLASQAALSMEFSRQNYWSGLPFPSPVDLPEPGIKLGSPALQADTYCLSHQRSPIMLWIILFTIILFTLIPRTMKITFTLFLLVSMYTRLPQLYFIQMHYIVSSLLDLLFCEIPLYILYFFLKFTFILYYEMLYSILISIYHSLNLCLCILFSCILPLALWAIGLLFTI